MIQVVIREIPKIKVELLDDAESTPGISRQQTRFMHEVKEELEQAVIKAMGPGSKTISDVLEKHNFKLVKLTDCRPGVIIDVESTER